MMVITAITPLWWGMLALALGWTLYVVLFWSGDSSLNLYREWRRNRYLRKHPHEAARLELEREERLKNLKRRHEKS